MVRVSRPEQAVTRAMGPYPPGSKAPRSAGGGRIRVALETADERTHWVEVHVVHALLQRDDRVVRDVDVLRADLLAALRDVAVTDARPSFQQRAPVERVLRMHLQPGDP